MIPYDRQVFQQIEHYEQQDDPSYTDFGFPPLVVPDHRAYDMVTFAGLKARFEETAMALDRNDEVHYELSLNAYYQARDWAYEWGQPHTEVHVITTEDLARVAVLLNRYRGLEEFEGSEIAIIRRELFSVLGRGMSGRGPDRLPTPMYTNEARYIAALGYVEGLYIRAQESRNGT